MYSIFSNMSSLFSDIPGLLLRIPVILLALTVHECAHGWVAYRCGDPTAKNMGRLNLNPLKHLDPIGTICMFLLGFGWAKPVPVNSRYFQKPKRDMALTALAGPVSNLILAFLGLILYASFFTILDTAGIVLDMPFTFKENVVYYFLKLLVLLFQLNVCLAIFNLLPIPPLDGSRIMNIVLPDRIYFGIMQYERYIYIGLLLLLWTGVLSAPLSALMEWVMGGMIALLRLIPVFSWL